MHLSNSQQTHKQRKEEKKKETTTTTTTKNQGGGREVKNKTGRREAVTEFDRLHMRTRTEL